jgi:hypothetical protein
MSDKNAPGDVISARIGGSVQGQVAVGKNIRQTNTVNAADTTVTQADLKALRDQFAELRSKIEREAPPDKQAAALERVSELETATLADKPKLSTMEYVKDWFVEHLPGFAAAVTSLIVNPIVGKLVGAAGDTLVNDFHHRFTT